MGFFAEDFFSLPYVWLALLLDNFKISKDLKLKKFLHHEH